MLFAVQLPWMQHGHDVVADSRFMIKYIQNTYGSQLKVQEPQDAASQAISTLVQRMCEEHMYFTSQYHRMVNPKVRPVLQTVQRSHLHQIPNHHPLTSSVISSYISLSQSRMYSACPLIQPCNASDMQLVYFRHLAGSRPTCLRMHLHGRLP